MVKVLEHCSGCENCLASCPVGALSIENGKAVVALGCIECDLCLNKCPVKQIIRLDAINELTKEVISTNDGNEPNREVVTENA